MPTVKRSRHAGGRHQESITRRAPATAKRVAVLAVLLSCSSVACSSSSSRPSAEAPPSTAPPTTAPSAPTTSTVLPRTGGGTTLTFNDAITLHTPQGWGIEVVNDVAFVGMSADPREARNLRIMMRFSEPIASLEPTRCEGGGARARPTSVALVESGFRPVGVHQAEFRLWRLTCPDGRTEERRAWVLPSSKVAFYEQRHDPANLDVVATAEVR